MTSQDHTKKQIEQKITPKVLKNLATHRPTFANTSFEKANEIPHNWRPNRTQITQKSHPQTVQKWILGGPVPSLTIIQIGHSGVPPFSIVSAPFSIVSPSFSIVSAQFSIVSAPFSIENGAEPKHLNSTRTARPPKGPGSSSRIQILKSKTLQWPSNGCPMPVK